FRLDFLGRLPVRKNLAGGITPPEHEKPKTLKGSDPLKILLSSGVLLPQLAAGSFRLSRTCLVAQAQQNCWWSVRRDQAGNSRFRRRSGAVHPRSHANVWEDRRKANRLVRLRV